MVQGIENWELAKGSWGCSLIIRVDFDRFNGHSLVGFDDASFVYATIGSFSKFGYDFYFFGRIHGLTF